MQLICKVCGVEFEETKGAKNRKYCSPECYHKGKISKVSVVCDVCGVTYESIPSKLKLSANHYCSRACTRIGQAPKIVKKPCEQCGVMMDMDSHQVAHGQRFCSYECFVESRKEFVTAVCQQCGKVFDTHTSSIEGGAKFCSPECSREHNRGDNHHAWKGGVSFAPYCPKFNNDRKRRVRSFFGNRCLACGEEQTDARRKLSVHHVDHDKGQGCSGKPFNLIPLCEKCHSKELTREAEYKTYINKTLEAGFEHGIWNRGEYQSYVMG